MTRPDPALDLLKAAAARNLRARWLVCERETGLVVATASLCRPHVTNPEHVVVPARAESAQ